MNSSTSSEHAPNAKRVLKERLRPEALSDDTLRQVQIELLSSALAKKRVSLYDAESAVPEAHLLAQTTREVERRTRDSCSFFSRLFGGNRCSEWKEHAKRVSEIENKIYILMTSQLP